MIPDYNYNSNSIICLGKVKIIKLTSFSKTLWTVKLFFLLSDLSAIASINY